MLLKKLKLENIRSYENQIINLIPGLTLLSGDIGSGKTTILLAIEFALFGLQPGQKGTSLLRTGTNEGKVELELEIDGKNILIERTLKKGNKSINQDSCAIVIDNERYEESVTEIKNKVLKLLNYPSEFSKKTNLLYKFTVYTPQEEMKQIILEPGDLRLNTLRHVFGIDKYKRIEENLTIIAGKIRERIRMNEGMIYDLENDKNQLIIKSNNLTELKSKQQIATKDYLQIVNERDLKEKDLEETNEKIQERKSLENEKSKSDVLISEKRTNIGSIENNIKGLRNQLDDAKKIEYDEEKYQSIIKRIQYQEEKEELLQKDYIQIISKINSNESKKNEIQNVKNKITNLSECPTCLQEVSDNHKKNINDKTDEELSYIQKNTSELAIEKNKLIEQIDITKKTKESYKNQKSEMELIKVKLENIKEKEKTIQELEKQKNNIQKDIDLLQKHLETIDKSIKEFDKFTKIHEEKTIQLEDLKKKENLAAIKKAEINKEIQFTEEQIQEKKKDIEKKEILKSKIDRMREFEYWLSKKFLDLILFTEKQVMLTLKEEFSKLFSQWFSILVSDSLNAKLDDDFSPIIEQQDYELDYAFLSGGERTAIALAYRLSLNQVINSMLSNIKTNNIVILDEPTDGFSSSQLDKMRDVLHQLKMDQILVVSHEQKIEGFVDNIIRFRKEFGITKVEY